MPSVRRKRYVRAAVTAAAAAALVAVLVPTTWADPTEDDLTDGQQRARSAGIQLAPKGAASAKSALKAPNPYLANLPDTKRADYSTWKQRMVAAGQQRAKSASLAANKTKAAGRSLGAAFVHDEEEPAGTRSSNDSQADAEPITGFGTGKKQNPRVRVLGSIADLSPEPTAIEVTEDNGSIKDATVTGIDGEGAVTTESVLGDGPYGGPSGSNDFDFFALTSRPGLRITVDTTRTPELDTVVAIYDKSGEILAANDDAFVAPNIFGSRLVFPVPEEGSYFVLVAGFASEPFPADPLDSSSGEGGADRGDYVLSLSSSQVDTDYYALKLKKGDVIGAVGKGVADTLTIWRPDGTQMVGVANLDLSWLYAPTSPLPGGGNTTLAYVAEGAGTYAIQVDGSPGAYDTLVEAYRPGSEIDRASRVQTIFLDFDGARVNTGIWGGPGVRELSPFGTFLGRWNLNRAAQEATVIDKITATVRENIRRDLIEQGLNDNLAVQVTNSKDNPDIFGKPNVSRVIVGGTIEQSGIPTIGVAQYIDPGNYGHEDSALVLLDVLSGSVDDWEGATLNYYLRPESNRVNFVSTAVGNVISHEIGHYIGSYHTDSTNDTHNVMDEGGGDFGSNLYGVGPDGIGGTADDEDIDFRTDTYSLVEGYTGQENTLNVSAWAFVRGGVVAQP
ncbi:MAG TPA: hypothetical protein VIT65_06520 [Microlunatus sp.]